MSKQPPRAEATPAQDHDRITLKLEGARAQRGVNLSDFETFIEHFLSALRDFDRARRGEQTRKTGHPEQRARAVTAFRLVEFRPGSGIATLEPEARSELGDEALFEDEEMPQVENLHALLTSVANEESLPDTVIEDLAKACRTFGDEGSIGVTSNGEDSEVRIDLPRIEAIKGARPAPADQTVSTVSGRLHFLDTEPDKLAIRASNGVDWTCTYPEELETHITSLVNTIVWAEGEGRLTSPLRGAMRIDRIQGLASFGEQSALWVLEAPGDEQLLREQGVKGPQGLATLAVEWDPETDEAYLRAMTDG